VVDTSGGEKIREKLPPTHKKPATPRGGKKNTDLKTARERYDDGGAGGGEGGNHVFEGVISSHIRGKRTTFWEGGNKNLPRKSRKGGGGDGAKETKTMKRVGEKASKRYQNNQVRKEKKKKEAVAPLFNIGEGGAEKKGVTRGDTTGEKLWETSRKRSWKKRKEKRHQHKTIQERKGKNLA